LHRVFICGKPSSLCLHARVCVSRGERLIRKADNTSSVARGDGWRRPPDGRDRAGAAAPVQRSLKVRVNVATVIFLPK